MQPNGIGKWIYGGTHGTPQPGGLRKWTVYSGSWKMGKRHGQGILTFSNRNVYEGGFRNDRRHGCGIYFYCDGRMYEGDWKQGAREGYGVFSSPKGNTYEGQFEEDERHGFGVALMADGTRLEGRWERGAFAPPRAGADGLEKMERKKARTAAARARNNRKRAYEQRALAIQSRAAAEEHVCHLQDTVLMEDSIDDRFCFFRYAAEQGIRETRDEFGSGTFNPQTHEVVEKSELDVIQKKLDRLSLAERRRVAKAALAKKQVDFETLQTQRGAIEAVADAHAAMRAVAAELALAKQGVITEELTDIANHKVSVKLRTQQLRLVHAVKRCAAAEQASQDSAEDTCRLKAPCCTAMDWILIPTFCSANP